MKIPLPAVPGLTLFLFAASASIAGAPGHTPTSAGSTADSVTPDQAWNMLREGNMRFTRGVTEHPNSDAARREEVAASQNPFAVILSCADSRVPVERLFDRGIGDLFVIRVAGNVSDTDEVGTIEYGVGHLHSPLVVVMGHSACGAVKAVASGAEVHGSIPGLVDNIIPAVDWVTKNRPDLKGDDLINAAIEANVWRSIDDLFTRSEEVRGLVQKNSVKVVGAVYDLASGRVRWLGEHPYQDRLLEPTSMPEPETPHAMNVPVPNREHAPTEPAPATASKPESKMPTHGPAPAKHSSKSATAPTHGTGHDEHR
jgi:carbonic anhydrase